MASTQLPKVQNFFWCMTLYVGAIVIGVFEVMQGTRSFFFEGGRIFRAPWIPLLYYDRKGVQ